MTWLSAPANSPVAPGDQLKLLLKDNNILRVPGAHNALAGLMAKRAGFPALYLSGGALTASMGLPDLGIITLEELTFFTKTIYRATGLPLIVDADTGYGEALNVMRAVQELEGAGAAAIQLEDQILPKKCGHLSDKRLVTIEEMAAKIAAANEARSSLQIIARTDAAAIGLDAAIARADAYVQAGADIVFPEALENKEAFEQFAIAINVPLLANMTEFGKSPDLSADELEIIGFKIAIWPVSSLRVASKAISHLYDRLAQDGTTSSMLDHMQTRRELYDLIGYHDYEALDHSISKSLLPGQN